MMKESSPTDTDADDDEQPGLREFNNYLYLAVNNSKTMSMTDLGDYYVSPAELSFLMQMYVSVDPLYARKR